MSGYCTEWLGQHTVVLESVDSTNSWCKTNAATLEHGTVVIARSQHMGKGRLGRQWVDFGEKGLYLSVLLKGYTPDRLGALPLLAGLAVLDAMRALCDAELSLKWSNDVLLGGRKLCGILCESIISGSEACAVIGIGVNVAQTSDDFAGHDLVYATSLFLATGKIEENHIIAAKILQNLEKVLEIYENDGFAQLRERYKSVCINLGKRVLFERTNATARMATAVDIAEDGALICIGEEGMFRVCSGEVSVRGIYGSL